MTPVLFLRMRKLFIWGLIFSGVPTSYSRGNSADPFVGEWLLSVHSGQGGGVAQGEMTVALRISKKGNFHGVVLEIPSAYTEIDYGGFSWAKFIGQSDRSLSGLTVGAARKKYAGEYVMDVDGKSIEHPSGSVTFRYEPQRGLLCEAGLGCFSRGSQSELIERYKRRQQDKAESDARAIAEGKARIMAEVKAIGEAKERARAQAEAEARRPRLLADVKFVIGARQDKASRVDLDARNRIDFRVTVAGGTQRALRVILLSEDGYQEWQRLKYNFSVFGRTEKQKTEEISGPCSEMLKKDVSERMAGSCILSAGTYYVVFYDAWNSFGDTSTNEVSVAYHLTARLEEQAGSIVATVPARSPSSGRHPAEAGYYELDNGDSDSRICQSSARFANVEYDAAWSALIEDIAKSADYKIRSQDADAGVIKFYQPGKNSRPPLDFEVALHEVGDEQSGIQIDLKLSVPRLLSVKKADVIQEFTRLMDVARRGR